IFPSSNFCVYSSILMFFATTSLEIRACNAVNFSFVMQPFFPIVESKNMFCVEAEHVTPKLNEDVTGIVKSPWNFTLWSNVIDCLNELRTKDMFSPTDQGASEANQLFSGSFGS